MVANLKIENIRFLYPTLFCRYHTLCSPVPVSYTHLDVYKRQAHALNENDLMKEIKRAKEVYNLLKTDSAESTLVFDTCLLYTSILVYVFPGKQHLPQETTQESLARIGRILPLSLIHI